MRAKEENSEIFFLVYSSKLLNVTGNNLLKKKNKNLEK